MSDDDLDRKEVARHFNESLENNMRLYEQACNGLPSSAPREASMAMHEKPSESADRVHLQWNGGWETWQEVMPQYAGEPGVVTFIRATTHQRTVEALREAEEVWTDFGRHTRLSLEFCYPEYDDPGVWMVHEVRGNRNDREWTLMGQGETPLDAVKAALARIKEATDAQR